MKAATHFSGVRIALALLVSWLLTGCATVPADRGSSLTTELLKSRSVHAAGVPVAGASAQSEVASLIAKPIGADEAVRLALLQNPSMRALYSELGFAQADIYDAGRLSNPTLGYLRLSGAGAVKTTWSVSQRFTELLFIGYRTRIGRSQLLQTQQRVASDVLALEAAVRKQYYHYVGAALIAQMRSRVADAANASASYAQQLYDAGNISALQLSREQAAAGVAEITRRRAQSGAFEARGALSNLLGLPLTNSQVAIIETLPVPNAFAVNAASLQAWALDNRLDLAAAREARAMWTTNQTHARRWRWLGGLSIGAERERESGGQTLTGPGAELELPLFNQGGGQLLRAQSSLELAKVKAAALEATIANDVLVRYDALQAAAASVNTYQKTVVPLHERIVALTQERQSFMLIGAFELLTAKQQEIDVYQSYLEAVRDYWIEHAELMRVAGGNLPGSDLTPRGTVGAGIAAQQANDDSNAPIEHDRGEHGSHTPAPSEVKP